MIEWKTKRVAVKDLKPFERNPRKITPEQYARLKDKIVRLGLSSPILATHDLRIVSGHQRLKILSELGVEHTEVRYPPYEMTDAQFREALIESNISDGTWDLGMLQLDYEPIALEGFGFDLSLFPRGAAPGLTDPDAEVIIGSAAVTELGEMWLMGNHRLRCGDSTDEKDVKALLDGARPHLMVTDPPYGVEYDAAWRNKVVRSNGTKVGARATGKVKNDDRMDWRQAWALFPGDVAYVWHAGRHASAVEDSLAACNFGIRAQIIWAKNNIAIGRGHYHWQHEPCWYAVREGGTGHWNGDRKQSTLWSIDKPQKSETGHSTQKPVECMRRPIENNSKPGDAIYEPFSGSGTTLIAAEMTDRRCFAMELDPLYVDMAVSRWEAFSGQEAVLAGTKKTFSTINRSRAA